MFNHIKTFFSEKKANDFIEFLKNNKINNIEFSSCRDAFGQIQYRVAWNEY